MHRKAGSLLYPLCLSILLLRIKFINKVNKSILLINEYKEGMNLEVI